MKQKKQKGFTAEEKKERLLVHLESTLTEALASIRYSPPSSSSSPSSPSSPSPSAGISRLSWSALRKRTQNKDGNERNDRGSLGDGRQGTIFPAILESEGEEGEGGKGAKEVVVKLMYFDSSKPLKNRAVVLGVDGFKREVSMYARIMYEMKKDSSPYSSSSSSSTSSSSPHFPPTLRCYGAGILDPQNERDDPHGFFRYLQTGKGKNEENEENEENESKVKDVVGFVVLDEASTGLWSKLELSFSPALFPSCPSFLSFPPSLSENDPSSSSSPPSLLFSLSLLLKIKWMKDVVGSMKFLSETCNILHRDLSVENVLLLPPSSSSSSSSSPYSPPTIPTLAHKLIEQHNGDPSSLPPPILSRFFHLLSHRCVVADFGVSTFAPQTSKIVRGSVRRYAPEAVDYLAYLEKLKEERNPKDEEPQQPQEQQQLPSHIYTKQSDIYMLGGIMVEILQNGPIFGQTPTDEVCVKKLSGETPSLHPNIPKKLKEVVEGCFKYREEDRAGFGEVEEGLDGVVRKFFEA